MTVMGVVLSQHYHRRTIIFIISINITISVVTYIFHSLFPDTVCININYNLKNIIVYKIDQTKVYSLLFPIFG